MEKAKREAATSKVAAEQAAAELDGLKVVSSKPEARVTEIQQELEEAISKCEALEQKAKEHVVDHTKLSAKFQSERVERRFYEDEVRQVKLMATGEQYLLQCAFGGNRYAFLTRIWRSARAFTNLP